MAHSTENKRTDWIDVLKCFGILAVIIGHIYRNDTVLGWFYSYHMPLFFFAGGLVYKKRDILSDLKARLYSTIVPYFVFGTLIALYWYFVERSFRDIDQTLGGAFLGLISGQYEYLEFHSHLWFLPCFFVTAVVYNILMNIGGKPVAYTVSLLITAAWVIFPIPSLPWGVDRVMMYIGLYAAGHAFMEHGAGEKTSALPLWIKAVGAAVLLCASVLLTDNGLTLGVMKYVTALAGIMAFLLIAMMTERVKLFVYVGRITLVTLCIHGPVYRVLIKLISIPMNCTTDEVRSNILPVLLITVVTTAICAAVYELLKRFVPWIIGVKRAKTDK